MASSQTARRRSGVRRLMAASCCMRSARVLVAWTSQRRRVLAPSCSTSPWRRALRVPLRVRARWRGHRGDGSSSARGAGSSRPCAAPYLAEPQQPRKRDRMPRWCPSIDRADRAYTCRVIACVVFVMSVTTLSVQRARRRISLCLVDRSLPSRCGHGRHHAVARPSLPCLDVGRARTCMSGGARANQVASTIMVL